MCAKLNKPADAKKKKADEESEFSVCGDIAAQVEVPIKVLQVVAGEFINADGLLAPLWKELSADAAASDKAKALGPSFRKVATDLQSFRDDFTRLRDLAGSMLGQDLESQSVQDGLSAGVDMLANVTFSPNSKEHPKEVAGNTLKSLFSGGKEAVLAEANVIADRIRQLKDDLGEFMTDLMCLVGVRREGCYSGSSAITSAGGGGAKRVATATIEKIKTAFREQLPFVFAMGEQLVEVFSPLQTVFVSVMKIFQRLKTIVTGIADLADQETNEA